MQQEWDRKEAGAPDPLVGSGCTSIRVRMSGKAVCSPALLCEKASASTLSGTVVPENCPTITKTGMTHPR